MFDLLTHFNTAVVPAPIENFFISTILRSLALLSGLAVTFVTLVTLILF